jgi:hypothetical protein
VHEIGKLFPEFANQHRHIIAYGFRQARGRDAYHSGTVFGHHVCEAQFKVRPPAYRVFRRAKMTRYPWVPEMTYNVALI